MALRPLPAGVDPTKANVVVAKDGSGNYEKIQDALNAAPSSSKDWFVIYVKAGTYEEYVEVTKDNISIVGDGIDRTVVTGHRNAIDGFPTFKSATFAVGGDRFLAQYMTFENTSGPDKGQAVAFKSTSLHSVCYRCSFKGYQDTLYVHSGKQFYRECDIYGTVDFIFGDAAAVVQNCNIYVRKPGENQNETTITAQSRGRPNDNTGISIHNSKIMATPDVLPSVKIYLGRPWGDYSRTVIMKTNIQGTIDPAGWLDWKGEEHRRNTLYYGEYMNSGEGANTDARVKWTGYHKNLNAQEASAFTVQNLLDGKSWIPIEVPYTPGL